MFSACRKFFQSKFAAVDSISFTLAVLHENHLSHEPILLRSCKVQCFVNLCSLVDADSSVLHSETGRKDCKSENKLQIKKSFTVSFLINSCGLSREMAISASENVWFENPKKPNAVITMFKNYGFSQTQIAKIVRKSPRLLVSKKKTLLPKLEFLQSVGLPKAQLCTVISGSPTLLCRSLENQLIPTYNFLKSVLLTDESVVTAMKRSLRVFLDKSIAPNIEVLRELKVPDSSIIYLLKQYPETFMQKTDCFKESVGKVLEMGFNPSKSTFVLALHVVSGKANRGIWDRCYETYRSWGWSKDDVYLAFRKHPNCMILSQDKISRTMDFLVNKMGWDSRLPLNCPDVLLFSLENRIIPRCTVIRVLLSRGLIGKEVSMGTFLNPQEPRFLERFVTRYEKEFPKLYDLYKGKVGLEEL